MRNKAGGGFQTADVAAVDGLLDRHENSKRRQGGIKVQKWHPGRNPCSAVPAETRGLSAHCQAAGEMGDWVHGPSDGFPVPESHLQPAGTDPTLQKALQTWAVGISGERYIAPVLWTTALYRFCAAAISWLSCCRSPSELRLSAGLMKHAHARVKSETELVGNTPRAGVGCWSRRVSQQGFCLGCPDLTAGTFAKNSACEAQSFQPAHLPAQECTIYVRKDRDSENT